jgi:hypothetical protein
VFRSKTVDRHDNIYVLQRSPFGRHRAKRARHDLNMDSAFNQNGDQCPDFAVADQWIASYQREVQRPQPVYDLQHSCDKGVSFAIV